MKKLLIPLGLAVFLSPVGFAESLLSAKVTKIVNDVRIFQPSASAKKAKVGDVINSRTTLQTGRRSRSELRFRDNTLTRVGANSIFSFERGTRDLHLEQGTILLTVPKNAGGARIRTATVTAAVTGTTIMMEYFPKTGVKIIVLEGSLVTWPQREGRKGARKTLRAGQMMILNANDTRMPKPVNIDLARLVKTSGLADRRVFGPMPKLAQNRISSAISHQSRQMRNGSLVPAHRGPQPSGSGPAGGGSHPGPRANNQRGLLNDNLRRLPPRACEGDLPGPPPSGGNPQCEGDHP